MSARLTWTLFFAAAAIAALIVFVEHPMRLEKFKVPDTRLLPGFKAAEATSVEVIVSGQRPIRAERDTKSWKLVSPVAYRAEAVHIEVLLAALQLLHWDSHIRSEELVARPEAKEEFGLRNPRATLTVQSPGGHQVQLLIGTNSIAGDQVYVSQTGGSGVHLVNGEFLRLVPASDALWRSLEILPAELLSKNSLRVRAAQRGFDLVRADTNSLWRIAWPLEARADNRRLVAGFDALRTNRVTGFVADGVTDFERFGLHAPSLEILFGEGTNFTSGLHIGSGPTNLPLLDFARRVGESNIFLVPKSATEAWRMSPAELRNPRLVDLPMSDITRVVVRSEDEFTIERGTTNQWAVTAPMRFPADDAMLRELLFTVTEAPAELEKAVVTDLKPYGLDKPLAEYRFEAPRGATNEAVSFQVGAAEGKVFVRRTDEISVGVMLPEVFVRLPRTAWQIGDRQVWSFDATNVTAVTIEQQARKKVLIRNPAGEWIVAPGSQGFVNAFGVEEALTRLGSLRAVYWTARGDVADTYGFKKTDYKLSLTLVKGGKTETLEVEFGGQSRQLYPYAATRIGGVRTVFEFPVEVFYNAVSEYLSIFKTRPNAP